MPSQQRILGFRVIEIKARQHRFRPAGGMATVANFFERAAMQLVDSPKNDLFTSFILISSRLAGSLCAVVWHFSQATLACLPSSL